MWHTRRGLRFIDGIARRFERGWRLYGTVSAVTGAFFMATVLAFFALNVISIMSRPMEATPGAVFVLPGLLPGLTVLYWLIGVASVVVVHEFAHGFVLRAQGLKVKSMGGLLFLFIPGAFVEPDEEQLKKAPILNRLRVYGAGSFANALFSFLVLGVILFLLVPKPGVYVQGVVEGSPAENVLSPGMRLLELDSVPVNTVEEFREFMRSASPGQSVSILTDAGRFSIQLAENPEDKDRGYLGVRLARPAIPRSEFLDLRVGVRELTMVFMGASALNSYAYEASAPRPLIEALIWVAALSFGIGLVNLLPIVPLDGGYIFSGLVERVSSERVARRVSYALSLAVLALIIINISPMLWRSL